MEKLMMLYKQYLLAEHAIDLDASGYDSRLKQLEELSNGDIQIAEIIINSAINRGEIMLSYP
jgi:hypothetical protein